MALFLSDDQVRLLRTAAQQLAVRRTYPATAVAQVVRDLGGVQAQEAEAAALGVRARCAGLVAADVERARTQERSVVRTWCMRGTLHLIATEDLGWLLGLLGPLFIRSSRGRRAELGLDEATGERAVTALQRVLEEQGPLTRAQIVEQLARRGIELLGQARPHLLGLAALRGIICEGPRRGREPTYVLLRDWVAVGPTLPPEQAGAELARRYLSAYAPATPEDFAAWSGLPLSAARAAWQSHAGRLVEVQTRAAPAWMLQTRAAWLEETWPSPVVRLLPRYDAYLLGYGDRSLLIESQYVRRIYPGGGMLHPALLVDGQVRGTWKAARRGEVLLEPFAELASDVWPVLDAEVEEVGRYLGGAGAAR